MTERFRLRAYSSGSGGGLLLTVPDRSSTGAALSRHILVDADRLPARSDDASASMSAMLRDVLAELGGQPLDLYVMTHEHAAHPNDLVEAASELGTPLDIMCAWLPAAAAAGYYGTHPQAEAWRTDAMGHIDAMGRYLEAAPDARAPWLDALLAANQPGRIRACGGDQSEAFRVSYLCRGAVPSQAHPLIESSFEVWAPEEDVSRYQGAFYPMALGLAPLGPRERKPRLSTPIPPAGVDAGAFYGLLEKRRNGLASNLVAIDRAANDASLVFCLLWQGRRLLLAGDIGRASWRTMAAQNQSAPVDLLQFTHHGGPDGIPGDDLLEALLPVGDGSEGRHAVITPSAVLELGAWDRDLAAQALSSRCELHWVGGEAEEAAGWLDVWVEPACGD